LKLLNSPPRPYWNICPIRWWHYACKIWICRKKGSTTNLDCVELYIVGKTRDYVGSVQPNRVGETLSRLNKSNGWVASSNLKHKQSYQGQASPTPKTLSGSSNGVDFRCVYSKGLVLKATGSSCFKSWPYWVGEKVFNMKWLPQLWL
jgi:hypothetical protein